MWIDIVCLAYRFVCFCFRWTYSIKWITLQNIHQLISSWHFMDWLCFGEVIAAWAKKGSWCCWYSGNVVVEIKLINLLNGLAEQQSGYYICVMCWNDGKKKSNKLGYFYFSFINDCLVAYSHWHINPTGWEVCCVPPQEEKRKIENVFSCIFDDSIFFFIPPSPWFSSIDKRRRWINSERWRLL